ncbi:MAG: hypothetical protein FWD25_06435 [Clostridia bacterium]|nr:hypothetical protein [Clostridia bacterium]
MYRDLYDLFCCLEGQPVRIFTNDGRAIEGIVLAASEESVRLIARHGAIVLVDNRHITSVEEPQMRMRVRKQERI